MKAFADFIRKHYQTIIIATVIVALLLGLWTTVPGKQIQRFSKALTFLMILFISFTLSPRQFALVVRQPVAVITGVLLTFVFMPLLCWALARLLVSDPQLITGIILIGVVPTAGMAAVWTALLKGDVPLVLSIEALTMMLGSFLIPILMVLLAGANVQVSPGAMFQQLIVILLIPLFLGVLGHWLLEKLWQPKPDLSMMPALSAVTAVLLMFAVCNANVPMMVAQKSLVPGLLVAVVLIFPLGFLLPHWLGRFAFGWEQRIAVTYSSGMKNLPIAVGLALTSFGRQGLVGLPIVLAFILQMLTASTFYRYLNRSRS
ncbi:MAG: bile acid:sodium symporter family protein [candidate division KSB1 bacterium]|nr:bile acid:sodium symporter family protein [candidate division KSB1 bacterium]